MSKKEANEAKAKMMNNTQMLEAGKKDRETKAKRRLDAGRVDDELEGFGGKKKNKAFTIADDDYYGGLDDYGQFE